MTQQIATMADLRTQLAERLQNQRNTMPPPTTSRIKMKVKEGFTLPDGTVLDTLEAVVVDMRYVNTYYSKRYSPGNVDAPDCWAVGEDYNLLAPDAASKKVQSEACEGCPLNEWGSAPGGGAGKACGNKIRLAVVPPDATVDSPIWTIDMPPTSAGQFLKVFRGLTLPMQTVIMTFSLDPKVDYPKVVTTLDGPAPDSLAPHLLPLMDKSKDPLDRGFDYDA
jgi:hypothetical protein